MIWDGHFSLCLIPFSLTLKREWTEAEQNKILSTPYEHDLLKRRGKNPGRNYALLNKITYIHKQYKVMYIYDTCLQQIRSGGWNVNNPFCPVLSEYIFLGAQVESNSLHYINTQQVNSSVSTRNFFFQPFLNSQQISVPLPPFKFPRLTQVDQLKTKNNFGLKDIFQDALNFSQIKPLRDKIYENDLWLCSLVQTF